MTTKEKLENDRKRQEMRATMQADLMKYSLTQQYQAADEVLKKLEEFDAEEEEE